MAVSIFNVAIIAGIVVGVLIVGMFVVVPAIVRGTIGVTPLSAKDWRDRVLLRYQNLCGEAGLPILAGTFAWVFAWFKLRLDPMFGELPGFLEGMGEIRTVLDIGCGYGVAGCALLEWRSDARIFGIDPEAARVRAAGAAFGSRGQAFVAGAPEFEMPGMPERFDAVLVLDVIHFMPDSALELTLRKIRGKMEEGGTLVIRSIIPPAGGGSWAWKIAGMRRAMTGAYACHRPVEKIREMIGRSGFEVEKVEMSGGNREMFWFIARAPVMKQENQCDDEQNDDVTDDQWDEPAGVEFVPLLKALKSAEQPAGAVDTAAPVVVGGRVALEGETGVNGVNAIGGQRPQQIIIGNILPGDFDEFLGEPAADDVPMGAAPEADLHNRTVAGLARRFDETAEEE